MYPLVLIGLEVSKLDIHQLDKFDMEAFAFTGLSYFVQWAKEKYDAPVVVRELGGHNVVGFVVAEQYLRTWPMQFIFLLTEARDDFKSIFRTEPKLYIVAE